MVVFSVAVFSAAVVASGPADSATVCVASTSPEVAATSGDVAPETTISESAGPEATATAAVETPAADTTAAEKPAAEKTEG